MKRSRTRRIVSLFMVLTGILLVFGGFLQDAGMPAAVADSVDVAAKPTKEPDWPCATWNCKAGDVNVLSAWLGDAQGDPLGACAQGTLVDAHVWLTIENGTGSDRPCPWLIFDLYVPGEPTTHFDKKAAETIPGASGKKIVSDYDVATLQWTCGQLVEVQGLVVSWGTSSKPECPPEKCAQRKTQCHGPETMPVEPPPILALSIEKIGDPGPVTCNDTIDYTITVTNSGDDTLHNVTVVDTKLGINQNVGTLAAGEFAEIKASYGPLTEGDLTGPIYNEASATSTETLVPVVADWTVTVTDDGPVLTCPLQINVQCPDGVPAAYGNLAAFEAAGGSATDKCGIDETSFKLFSELSDGKTCPETITRIYEIADTSGNKAQCTQLIVVDDTIPPVITCPPDVEVCTVPGETTASVVLGTATATDNCDPHPVVTNNALTTFPAGDTTVTWTATDACGNTATCTQKVTVKVSPVASFDTGRGVGPLDVQFTDTSSGNIKEWSWHFGDTGTATEQHPTHTYAAGTYTVRLTVTDFNGCTHYIDKVIAVSATMIIEITSTDDPCDGYEICFWGWADIAPQGRVSLSALEGYTFLWDFGDPDTSDDWSDKDDPCYMYTGPGTYDVTLTVTHDETEVSATANKQVTVYANPTASFTAVPASGVAPLTVQFNDGSSKGSPNGGAIIDWDWDFGDPASGVDDSSTLKDPTHVYASAGTYTVVLIVTDEHGCTDSDTATVTVTRPDLSIEKTGDKEEAMVGQPINYTYLVTNLGDVTLTNVTVTDDKLGSIELGSTTLAVGESTTGVASYTALVSDVGVLENTATASSDQAGPVEAKWSVLVVKPEAPPALLSIQKTGDAGPLSVGDTINYTIKVINSGDAVLTNVVVNDAKLGIIDRNIGDLDPGATAQLTASYGPLEESDVGFVDNTAIASSDQTDPVEDSWRVQVVAPEQPPETPTPVPTPTPIPCIRSDIDVIVYGKIPVEVDMYVAGDLYHSKQTAVNAFGEQQATFSIWPGEGETYVVSITPRLPGYLDPDEWTFQLIKGSLSMRIPRCVHREVILQLLHAGPSVTPTPAPTLPVEELPVTGVPLPASSFGGRLLKLLGFLLIGSGGLFYWTSKRD